MKPNDRIMVYIDPLTEKKPEEHAILIKRINDDVGWYDGRRLERWRVRFPRDSLITERNILVPKDDSTD